MNRRGFFGVITAAVAGTAAVPRLTVCEVLTGPSFRHKEYGLAFDIDPKDLTDAAEFGRRARALQMSAQTLIEKHALDVIEPVRFTVRLKTGMDA